MDNLRGFLGIRRTDKVKNDSKGVMQSDEKGRRKDG